MLIAGGLVIRDGYFNDEAYMIRCIMMNKERICSPKLDELHLALSQGDIPRICEPFYMPFMQWKYYIELKGIYPSFAT